MSTTCAYSAVLRGPECPRKTLHGPHDSCLRGMFSILIRVSGTHGTGGDCTAEARGTHPRWVSVSAPWPARNRAGVTLLSWPPRLLPAGPLVGGRQGTVSRCSIV